ncbi:MAG: hypothetical protein ACLTCI_01580 [[Clostridium] nexile]
MRTLQRLHLTESEKGKFYVYGLGQMSLYDKAGMQFKRPMRYQA